MKKVGTIFFLLLYVAGFVAVLQTQPLARGSAAHDYIGLYQRHLSGMLRSRCQMYPTCSRYGMMVFEDYLFPVAMTMMADRMIRCGNHREFYHQVTLGDGSLQMLDFPPSRPEAAKLAGFSLRNVAAETIVPDDSVSRAIQFTNRLVNSHCYASAMLEIDRLLYYDTSFVHEPALYVNKLRCYEGLGQYSDGLLFFESGIPARQKSDYKVLYTAAHLYDLVGDSRKAIAYFEASALCWDSNEAHPFGELAVAYTKESMFDKARASLEKKQSIDGNLQAFVSSKAVVDRLESARYKNPTVAMLLGIVPGAGYLYAGQPGSALTSLLVNAALAYATYTSFKTDNYGLGIVVGLFSASFYIGNIAGSGNGASRYNERLKRDAINELRIFNPFIY